MTTKLSKFPYEDQRVVHVDGIDAKPRPAYIPWAFRMAEASAVIEDKMRLSGEITHVLDLADLNKAVRILASQPFSDPGHVENFRRRVEHLRQAKAAT